MVSLERCKMFIVIGDRARSRSKFSLLAHNDAVPKGQGAYADKVVLLREIVFDGLLAAIVAVIEKLEVHGTLLGRKRCKTHGPFVQLRDVSIDAELRLLPGCLKQLGREPQRHEELEF